jgi:hypothetical protein
MRGWDRLAPENVHADRDNLKMINVDARSMEARLPAWARGICVVADVIDHKTVRYRSVDGFVRHPMSSRPFAAPHQGAVAVTVELPVKLNAWSHHN